MTLSFIVLGLQPQTVLSSTYLGICGVCKLNATSSSSIFFSQSLSS